MMKYLTRRVVGAVVVALVLGALATFGLTR